MLLLPEALAPISTVNGPNFSSASLKFLKRSRRSEVYMGRFLRGDFTSHSTYPTRISIRLRHN